MKLFFLTIRDFIIKNFFVTIKAIEYKKYKLVDSYIFLLFKLIPFSLVKILFNYMNLNYIYYFDNIYHSNSETFFLRPTILSFKIHNKNEESNNLIEKIKLYQLSVPFWFFIYNEKLENYDDFEIKYFSKGKMVEQFYKFSDFKTKLLMDVF